VNKNGGTKNGGIFMDKKKSNKKTKAVSQNSFSKSSAPLKGSQQNQTSRRKVNMGRDK